MSINESNKKLTRFQAKYILGIIYKYFCKCSVSLKTYPGKPLNRTHLNF